VNIFSSIAFYSVFFPKARSWYSKPVLPDSKIPILEGLEKKLLLCVFYDLLVFLRPFGVSNWV
jgi:hypothetical protein